jgi:REP-associated tyrosine transposase
LRNPEQFSEQYQLWVQEAITNGKKQRESCWSGSIAVGSAGYVEEIRTKLGLKRIGIITEEQEYARCVLGEEPEPYNAVSAQKMSFSALGIGISG